MCNYVVLLLAFISGLLQSEQKGVSCWGGGFTRDHCCDERHGPTGNPSCWDDHFSFSICCTVAPDAEAELQVKDLQLYYGDWLDKLERQDGLVPDTLRHIVEMWGLEALLRSTASPYEHCWQGGAYTEQECCNLTLGQTGNPICWEQASIYRYEICCDSGAWMDRAAAAGILALRYLRLSMKALSYMQLKNVPVSPTGSWIGKAAVAEHVHDKFFSISLANFFRSKSVRSVIDFGCGLGNYVKDLRQFGFRAAGVDGNPATHWLSGGACWVADLSETLDFGTRWDWLLSLEVAEHIPRELEEVFLQNLERHVCRGLVLSWDSSNEGHGHINLRSEEYVKSRFAEYGFESLDFVADTFRQAAVMPWLKRNLLVFERRTPLSEECCLG